MICPKCGMRQINAEDKCANCGVRFSKITISSWESPYAGMAMLWWHEPRGFLRKIEPSRFVKFGVFILIASTFSYIWLHKLSLNPFIAFAVSLGIGSLSVFALKLLDSSSPQNIYMTATEIIRARGREHEKLRYQEIKECLLVQNNNDKDVNHLEITTLDDKRRFLGVPDKLDPAEVIAALKTHNVKCELCRR